MAARASIALVCLAVLAVGTAGASPSDNGGLGASAEAYAIKVFLPGGAGGGTPTISAPPQDTFSSGPPFAYPADGSAVSSSSNTSSVQSSTSGSATANASAQVTGLSLFNGELTATTVSAGVRATANDHAASGDLPGTVVAGLSVLGQPVSAAPGTHLTLGDWGYAYVLQETVSSKAPAGGRGHSASVTALEVHLTADHGGLPAGSEILVGHAEASAQALTTPSHPSSKTTSAPHAVAPGSKTAPAKAPSKAPLVKPKRKLPKAPEPKRPKSGLPRSPFLPLPLGLTPRLTPERRVFPVYGNSNYTDTFGAARADVSYHHGDDIFAPLGAPILAVADGKVFSVGWNDIGGNRLWLLDHQGNQFYYAHLSAYSPLAVNGREVKAGDVLGFMGNTGDAEGTPYHLHFEVHPVAYLYKGYDGAVDPTSYLDGWQRLKDVRFTAAAGWVPPAQASSSAPKPGAILLQVRDISNASGLEPGSLRRAFEAPVSSEGDGSFFRSSESSGTAAGAAADR